MCGITSIFRNDRKVDRDMEELLTNLLWVGSIRGHDSTGIMTKTHSPKGASSRFDRGPDVYKKAMPGYDFIHSRTLRPILRSPEAYSVIVTHNRAATKGSVDHDNAHPFQIDDITGVHNGTLFNHYSLSPVGVNHSVDSYHLYAAIRNSGAAEILPKVDGSFNLIWHDQSDNTIHQVRNSDRPYCFAKLKGLDVLVGASEKPMLKWLLKRHHFEIEYCWTPDPMTEYIWAVDEDLVRPIHEVQHKAFKKPKGVDMRGKPHQNQTGQGSSNNGTSSQIGDAKRYESSDPENLEFFFDKIEKYKPYNGYVSREMKDAVTLTGKTTDGEVVTVYGVERSAFELDVWYQGQGFQTTIPGRKGKVLIRASIKAMPPLGDEDVDLCTGCEEWIPESQLIYSGSAAICLPCCQKFEIKLSELDDPDVDGPKLKTIGAKP